jgi:hypothetical protein
MTETGHALRDKQTGMIRKDIHIINIRILDASVQQDESTRINEIISKALKDTGNDKEYVVITTPPGVILDVEWMQPYLKKLEDFEVLMKDADFAAQMKRTLELARQRRWNTQNPPAGAFY